MLVTMVTNHQTPLENYGCMLTNILGTELTDCAAHTQTACETLSVAVSIETAVCRRTHFQFLPNQFPFSRAENCFMCLGWKLQLIRHRYPAEYTFWHTVFISVQDCLCWQGNQGSLCDRQPSLHINIRSFMLWGQYQTWRLWGYDEDNGERTRIRVQRR